MRRSTRYSLLLPILLFTLLPATALAQGEAPVTLRLAVADDPGAPSDPYVQAFVDSVSSLSGGAITIEPVWGAGQDAYEQGVAHGLVDGEFDLGLAASRAWDDAGITSLMALQAPFLIDNDALALAVATSDVATAMLEGMGEEGVTGLALWPEDLRHPVAFEGCISPLIAPGDFAGKTIRAINSGVTIAMLEALGATHTNSPDWRLGAESCDIQGAESGLTQGQSLPGKPTFTGDVTFYPKFQVLAASTAAYGRLSDTHRNVLEQAAERVRDRAISEHRSDADAAHEWCEAGGRVVLAGPEAIAAFTVAARPVFDDLVTDPVTAAAIDAIQVLRTDILPSPTAEACDLDPIPSTPPAASGAPSTAVSEVPADGVWRIDIKPENLEAAGLGPAQVDNSVGLYTWTFRGDGDGSNGTFDLLVESPILGSASCGGTYRLESGGYLRIMFLTGSNCGPGHWMPWIWTPSNNGEAQVRVPDVPGFADEVDQAMWGSAPFIRID